MEQRSAEWYAIKAGKLSGSRFTDLMKTTGGRPAVEAKPATETLRDADGNVVTRASKAQPAKPAVPGKPTAARANLIGQLVTERFTGKLTEIFQTYAMRRGIELEDDAVSLYEDRNMVVVDSIGWIEHEKHDFIGVSPDGLVGDDGLIEVKCPFADNNHLQALLDPMYTYEQYQWQVQGMLWVTGRSWCDVVTYDDRWKKSMQLAIARVEPDLDMHKQLEDACIVANDEVEAIIKTLEERYEA